MGTLNFGDPNASVIVPESVHRVSVALYILYPSKSSPVIRSTEYSALSFQYKVTYPSPAKAQTRGNSGALAKL